MKALIYKELKLAMHPICYVFTLLFPLLLLIPKYPISIGFIYLLSCYPILFLGANKGQQSNDLLYTALLPVRKKDIVFARLITVTLMHFAFIIIMCLLYPVATLLHNEMAIAEPETNLDNAGIPLSGFISIIGISLVGLAICNFIYFTIYYKKGKSILLSTLLSIFFFAIYITVLTIVLPYVSQEYYNFVCGKVFGPQLIILFVGLALYVLLDCATLKVSAKELEKVDL